MSNQTDLDLTRVESSDLDQLASKVEAFYKQDTSQKAALAYNWERNHMMLDGQHWIKFEGSRETGGIWKRIQPNEANSYIPRPVTNYLFDAYQSLKGYLLKNDPRITVRPNTRTNKDKTAAKIAELVSETNWERLHEVENYEYAASVAIPYGTVFKKSYWDTSSLSMARVPRMEPSLNPETGQLEEIQATDPMTGEKLFDEIPLGDVATCVVEPYRIALDPLASTLQDLRWIMEYSIRPISWVVENYDKQEPGYTGLAKEVKPEKALSASLQKFYNLKTSSGVKGTVMTDGTDGMPEECVVVKEVYEAPCRKYPKGRLIVVANTKTIYVDASPYSGPEQGDWHPYSEFRWEIVPGRFWGKSPFDDGCEINKQINSIDSVITLTRKTMAVPQKLEPRGTLPKNTSWTGQPGQRVTYTPGPSGEKPEIIPATGVHEQVFQERSQKVEDLKNITGAIDILKGDRPPGVTAHSALSLLFEVGTGKLQPILRRWKRFIESDQKKQLRLIAVKYREPRPDFIRWLMSKNQELTEDQIKNFIGADLHDNCNVIIEASSAIPKLRAAEDAKLMELANTGVLALEDPANRAEFLDRMGIVGFDNAYSVDVKRAEWENDLMDNIVHSPDNRPIVLECDNHDIHIEVIDRRMKEPSYLELPPEVQQVYMEHKAEHEQMKHMQEQMQIMQGMPPGPNPMQQPPEPIRKGAPVPKEAKAAQFADILGPRTGVSK